MNHISSDNLRKMAQNPSSVVPAEIAAQVLSQFSCSACMSTNQPRGYYSRTPYEYERAEAACSDSHGPLPVVEVGCGRHFVTLIDVATRLAATIWIVFRDEILELIDFTFNNLVLEHGCTLKIFVSDNANEYLSRRFRDSLHHHSCTYIST